MIYTYDIQRHEETEIGLSNFVNDNTGEENVMILMLTEFKYNGTVHDCVNNHFSGKWSSSYVKVIFMMKTCFNCMN